MIDLEAVRKLDIQDGNLLVVPENTDQEDMRLLLEALNRMKSGCQVLIVRGPLELMDVGAMNKLGWYRA
ncbi:MULTISPECIES: hypothetical protein [unclassified Pseudomonas]|uniref:hypothetical protein n=1 Tax=unclassified Pseudomonas TaxID=196821 RepID=UPI0005367172|nr:MULTISPECIES: hypothetical protein [unclassified Pseudomonas]MBD0683301.1 hypothetical protein [Pseudomonas sp. PSB18]CDF94179.1 hypothetical protein BN844_1614 [Pseudomonas sp. SHC52]